MNTILDQNSGDIREALSDYPSILEHHSNIIPEDETEEKHYHRLTERWESDIILTSLVQFLDTLFKNGNGKARRMYRLANSVLIFDEIQLFRKNAGNSLSGRFNSLYSIVAAQSCSVRRRSRILN